MILTFQGGDQFAKLDMDRKNKKLVVTSSKTGYKPVAAPWSRLFDPGKEKRQEKITDQLTDEEFKSVIIAGMQQNGYMFKLEEKAKV